MREEDLLEFLIFIAEEDAQISSIVNFFINTLDYELTTIKKIINYGIDKKIFIIVENGEEHKGYKVLNENDIKNVDWSTLNNLNEIYYCDFDYYRDILFSSCPQISMEFKQFVIKNN
jgi:hypothetical protein